MRSALALSMLLAACTGEEDGAPDRRSTPARPGASTAAAGWFSEVARSSGIDFTHDGGAAGDYQLPEIMGSGCAWIDVDLDGDLDAYLVSAGHDPGRARNRLYRNRGGGEFEDVTDDSGAGDTGFGMGCAVADVDGDGFPDIYVTNFGANALYRNNGDGTFTDVTAAAGVGERRWSASAAFVDVDADGALDLFVTNYMSHPERSDQPCADAAGRIEYCGPHSHFAPEPDTLYRNLGDGRFADVTRQAGMGDARGYGLGVVCADFNGDGHADIYVANDATANRLWINDGTGRFVDRGVEWGAAFNQHGRPEAGMGVDVADLDGDGGLDIFVTNLVNETNTLYRGLGDGLFDDVTHACGLGPPSLASTGFGAGFLDVDLDGDLDILVTNGRIRRGPLVDGVDLPAPWGRYAERDQLFERAGESGGPGTIAFVERSVEAGLGGLRPHVGRGLALGDHDNDGDVDVLVTACGGAARLYRNDAPRRGRWLTVVPLAPGGRGVVLGARVTVVADGATRIRESRAAASYLSSNDPRVHFGLGDVERAAVTIRWPDGAETAAGEVPLDRIVEIEKGRDGFTVRPPVESTRAPAEMVTAVESTRVPAASPAANDTPPMPDPSRLDEPLRSALASAIGRVEAEPDDAQRWGDLAMLCHAHGLHEDARVAYRKAEALDDADSLWPHLLGLVCDVLSLHDEAVRAYRRSIEMEPYDIVSRCSLANILETRGEHERARELYVEVVEMSPKSVAARVGLGRLAARAGALEMAEKNLELALEEHPRCGPAHAVLARIYRARGDDRRAELHRRWSLACGSLVPLPDPYMERVQSLGVTHTARMKLGEIAGKQRRWDDAIEHYRAAMSLRPDLAEPRYLLGISLARAGRVGDALETLRAVPEGSGKRVEALIEVASLEAARGNLETAAATIEKALSIEPRNPAALVALGNLHRARRHRESALASYDGAIAAAPDFARAHLERGVLLHIRGASSEDAAADPDVRARERHRAAEALAAFERALEAEADLAPAYEGAGRAHMQLWELSTDDEEKRRHVDAAIERFSQAVRFFPGRKGAHIALIRALHSAGRPRDVVAAIRRARERFPEDPRFVRRAAGDSRAEAEN